MVLQRGADAALERLLNLPVIKQIEGIPEPEQLEQRPEPFPRRLRLVRRRAEVQPSPVEPLFPRRLRLVRGQVGVQPPPVKPPIPSPEGEPFVPFEQPPISPVSAKVTPSRFFAPLPEEEPEEEPEVTFGANPTFWLWKRKLLPEFMFSSMDAQRDIRAGQEGLPGIKRVEDIEVRRREELARDPNPLIRLANTPTVVGGLTPADFVGLGLIAYGGYVGVRSLIPVTKEIANKTLQSALNTGLDKWIAQRSRGVPPQHFKTIQNMLYNTLVQNKTWLQQRATENMLRRMGRGVNQTVAARETVQEVIAEFDTRLPILIPRGTRTGAMAFGGRQANITAQTIADKIINRQPLTRAEEQFRVNNRQAVEAVLLREAKPIVPPEPVAPAPEVRISVGAGEVAVWDVQGKKFVVTKGKPIKIAGFEEYDFAVARPLGVEGQPATTNWNVIESKTGMLVSDGSFPTRQKAIDSATARLTKVGKEKTDLAIRTEMSMRRPEVTKPPEPVTPEVTAKLTQMVDPKTDTMVVKGLYQDLRNTPLEPQARANLYKRFTKEEADSFLAGLRPLETIPKAKPVTPTAPAVAIPKAEPVPEAPAVAEAPPSQKIRAIHQQGAVNPEAVGAEEAKAAHIELAAPDGIKPPPPPVTKPSSSSKPEDVMRFITQRAIEGERPDQALLRLHEAAVNSETRRVNLLIKDGGERLKKAGIGVWRRAQLVPKEGDIPKLNQLYVALHNRSRVETGEVQIPKGLEDIYAELQTLTDWEELARLDFDPNMATVMDYFYRGWKPPEGAFADVNQGRPLVRTPAFKKPRVNATFEEMREAGFEPLFWNPYQQWGISRMQGVRYREQMELVNRLKHMGEEFIRPHDGGPIPKGWRVPEVGPAFEGKPFAYTSTTTGEPAVMFTRRWIVPDKIANAMENIYGKRPDLGKFVIGGKTVDPMSVIDIATFFPKRAKLFGSLFQQVDFLVRSGIGSWTGAVDSLMAGRPIKAVSQVIRYPKTAAEIIQSNFSPAKRRSLKEMLDDTTSLVKGRENVHFKGISEAGLSTIDVTIFPADMDKLVRQEAEAAGIKHWPAHLVRAVGDLESAMRRGLFEGTYPAAQTTDIRNNIAPMIARAFPQATDEQINGMIAVYTNTKYSTLPAAQSVLQNRILRETLRRLFFSIGENEGLLRQATGAFHGPYKSFWRKHWIGAGLFLITTAEIIHWASTGKPLPWERWSPIAKDNWGPLPFGYNRDFAAPTIPIKGRGGTEITLDLVGQMDTAFRVLDPVSFLSARESVPIRAAVNQFSGTDFFGAPIDDVGPGGIVSRSLQLLYDLFAPIGPGQSGLEMVRSAVPGMEDMLPRGESRLGMQGLIWQTTGINLRAETSPQLLDRSARESGFKKRDGTLVKVWADLEPHQKKKVQENETLKQELEKRGTVSALTGSMPARRRILFDEIDQIMFSMEEALAKDFTEGAIEPRDFANRYNEIQSERANQKIGAMFALEMMGYDRKLPPITKRQERISYLFEQLPQDDMNERALGEYYLIFELARTATGAINWDVRDALVEFYNERWTAEQRAYVEDNTGLRDHPPLISEFIDAKKQLKPYWELPELPRSIRESYRLWHPDIDAILVNWYGYKPVGQREGASQFPVPAGGRKLRLIKRK